MGHKRLISGANGHAVGVANPPIPGATLLPSAESNFLSVTGCAMTAFSRILTGMGVLAAATTLAATAMMVAGIKTQTTPPPEVFENSDVGRERMRRLWIGLCIYENEHSHGPSEPAELFPHYVPDALTFWHPGDSDPPPTTIDNSVPNAPNSARISFEWLEPLRCEADYADSFLIWDNSADNNAGYFINRYSGIFETDPPLATPTPTSVAIAQARLRSIGWAMKIYTNENSEYLPTSLLRLWESGGWSRTDSFWNPGNPLPPPETFTTSEPDAPNSIQGSFYYYGMGYQDWELRPIQVLMQDVHRRNNGGVGLNVLWGDWRVTFELFDGRPRGDGNQDWIVDVADLPHLLTCLSGPATPIIDVRCRVFDWESNDRVDLRDVALFAQTFDH